MLCEYEMEVSLEYYAGIKVPQVGEQQDARLL